MFAGEVRDDATNKRVGSRVGQCFLPEPTGSGFSRVFGLNHSDSAAHAKHYVPFQGSLNIYLNVSLGEVNQ